MLVLTRKPNQVIYVKHGEETLKVSVLACEGQQVKLAFDGPMSFNVYREELEYTRPEYAARRGGK